MLQLYNCTRIYLVKYRRSIAFHTCIIYICGHFSVARDGETQTSESRTSHCPHSEHHTMFIGCQHQGCPHYCLGQGIGAMLTLGNAPYRLQRVWFVASRLSIFAALPRTMNRSNTKLIEGMNGLF